MNNALTVCSTPTDRERDAILAPLAAFNAAHGYPADPKPVAILISDDSGATIGGLWGRTGYGWLYVEYLVVPESLRGKGIGSELLTAAEGVAVARGCGGAWLTTFSFQARGFYEKLGYAVFGTLDRSPGDNVRIFLRKRLDPSTDGVGGDPAGVSVDA